MCNQASINKTVSRDPYPARWLFSALLVLASAQSAGDQEVFIQGADLFDAGVFPATVQVDMHELPPAESWRPGDPIKEIPQRKGVPRDFVPPVMAPQPRGGDALLALDKRFARRSGGQAFGSALVDQPGGDFSGVNPPDAVGDVGNAYYIQMINGNAGSQVFILDKSGGRQVADFGLATLAEGSGTGCTEGVGDPIVMFDSTVDNGPDAPSGRWFLAEFTSASLCVYISATSNPMAGAWHVFEFFSDSGDLPDYPKYGVWPDAYYIGANEDGESNPAAGRIVYALDRERMLEGDPTRPTQVFEAPPMKGFGFQMLHPVDWDGAEPPPEGAPGLFVRHRDDEVHDADLANPNRDFVEIWEFSLDWDSPANSTFSGPAEIGVADFESDLCGLSAFACVPQPGSDIRLDPLREPMMWRLQYRNFGAHQALVGSWVTDVEGGGNDLHGVRWVELHDTGAGWALYQQGTLSLDAIHRWMPSIAMDGSGNLALGYNVSDADSVFPGLRYSGRLAADPLDTMPRGEFVLADGSAANASNRYGDYAAMSVDPVDECTFWFTGQYNETSQWSTRVAAFRFDDCGGPGFVLSAAENAGSVCTAQTDAAFSTEIDLLAFNDFSDPVDLSFEFSPDSGLTGILAPDSASPGDEVGGTIIVDQSVAGGEYKVSVNGRSTVEGDRLELLLRVFDALPGGTALEQPDDGTTHMLDRPRLAWTPVEGAENYRLEIATDPNFATIVYSTEVEATNHEVAVPLAFDTQHFWRVVPLNLCGSGSASQTFSFTTMPSPGACTAELPVVDVFADDMEDENGDWVPGSGGSDSTWTRIVDGTADNGTTVWNAQNLPSVSDQRLLSPAIQLPGAEMRPITLRFGNRQGIESDGDSACWDAAVVEISTDAGGNWEPVGGDMLLFREHDGITNSVSSNPLSGLPGWCGDPRAWEDYEIDLSAFSGQTIELRFRLGTDAAEGRDIGWSVDDVRVEACATELLFSDGFESPLL